MRGLSGRRWVWVVGLFAVINIVGLVKIVDVLQGRAEGLKVESFSPQVETAAGSVITVRFTAAMVAPEDVGAAVDEEFVSISPEARGKWTWIGTHTLRFQPEERLRLATPYVVRISPLLRDLTGRALGEEAVLQFNTAALRLVGLRQTNLSKDHNVTLAFEFNARVAPACLKEHLDLTGSDGKALSCAVSTQVPDRTILVKTGPVTSATIVAKVRKGLKCLSGPLGLEADVSRQVRVELALVIENVAAYARVSGEGTIWVECSQRVDLETARDYIRIEPKTAFTVTRRYCGFRLEGAFKPSTRYKIRFLKGLKGLNGTFLQRDVMRSVEVPDADPVLRFKTRGIYLSAGGNLLLPLESMNVNKAKVTIEEVYENNIVHYMRSFGRRCTPREMGRTIARKEYVPAGSRNEMQVKHLDLREMLGEGRRGVFLATARDAKFRWRSARKLVMLTDLGISVKKSPTDLLVWVNTLSASKPVAGARVRVFTRSNQAVLEGHTDGNGLLHLKGVDWSGDRKPFAVIVSHGADRGFIELGETTIDHAPFDTGGRPWQRKGYEAMVYTDRGIYRPGEKARAHVVVRSPGPAIPKGFPVRIRIGRPDGREFKTLAKKLNAWGSADVSVDLPSYALTGRYSVGVALPGGGSSIGKGTFQVEEFIPDRMKVAVTAEERRYQSGEDIRFMVKAAHLFGAPAAGRSVEGRCKLVGAPFSPSGLSDYVFGDPEKSFAPVRLQLQQATLDSRGEKAFAVRIPTGLSPPSALRAIFTASVKEVGGRAVTACLCRDVDVRPCYVGLKRASEGYAEVGREERVVCVLVRPNGERLQEGSLKAKVCRIVWNTVLKHDEHGRYRYHSAREEKPVAELDGLLRDGSGEVRFTPDSAGYYKLTVRDRRTGPASAVTFYCAGPGCAPWAMDKPDRLELAPDKESYAPGETARILLKSPFSGRVLFTVESDRIHLVRAFTLAGNTREITLTMAAGWGPNAYCSATVIRPVDPAARWAAHRAFGAVPLMLDNGPHRLKIAVTAPGEVRPGRKLRVGLRVSDRAGAGRRCEVTVAAVDEGICRLTRFATPDPWGFFYAKRRLEVTTADVYALLMPEVERTKVGSDSDAGGDTPGEGARRGYDPRLLNPVYADRVRTVALWRGSVITGEDGRAEVAFDVPKFNGQLRLMVVAAAARDFGAAHKAVLVKEALSIRASLPRFLAPNDAFVVPVTVFNQTGSAGEVRIGIAGSPGLRFDPQKEQTAPLPGGGEHTVLFRVKAPSVPGKAKLEVKAALGDERASESVEIPVRPVSPLRRFAGSGCVAAGTTGGFRLPGKWLAHTDRYRISFSSLPALKFAGGLRYVLRYPYGCAEQTTSSAFPLLYLSDIAATSDPEMFRREEVELFVQAGIDRLVSMQTWRGGFGWWPGSQRPYPWGSAYATHFLVEAEKAGHGVPEHVLKNALAYLESLLSSSQEGVGLPEKAYACFVLARAGQPNRSWTYRLHERRDELAAYSRFQTAAALALMKEGKLAREAMQLQGLPKAAEGRDTGGSLHSAVREAAILLSVYMDTDPRNPNVPLLVKRLESAMSNGRWATTQENGFAMMALGKYVRYLKTEEPAYQAELRVGGAKLASLTHKQSITLSPQGMGGKRIEVGVKGKGSLYYCWWAEGIPLGDDAKEVDNGLKVRRRVLSRDETAQDLSKIKQGEVVIVEISVRNFEAVANVVISDLLPAGLEIENPRIATRDAAAVQASRGRFTPKHVEMRDDRLLLFADFGSAGEHVYRYAARAVTRGRFRLPPINAVCMYRPGLSSTHGAGHIEVVDGR